MTLKKLNALVAWLAMLSLLGHMVTMTYSLLTGWYNFSICKGLAYCTAITVGAHVLIVLIIFFFQHDGASTSYAKLNARTIEQRASALVVLLLLHAHVKSFGFIVAGAPVSLLTKILIIVTEVLFFTAIFSHVVTSFSRSLITLGLIRSDEAEARVTKIVSRTCTVMLVIICLALIRFVVMWPTA